jgi:hypothetical protein
VAAAYYEILAEGPDSGRYRSTEHTSGPWSEQLQHGGPPNALVVAAAERVVTTETGRSDLTALRLATEFIGPVPVAEVETHARVLRAARGAVLAEVRLVAGDRDCLHSRIWLVRNADTTAIAPPLGPATEPPEAAGLDGDFGYARSLQWRVLRGGLHVPGPGAAWVRSRTQLTDAHQLTGLQFAALVGDSASGISSELDWTVWSFVNVDLDIHLARPVVGEWLYMDAATQLGPGGAALTRSTLSDARGAVGATLQTLVLAPHRR